LINLKNSLHDTRNVNSLSPQVDHASMQAALVSFSDIPAHLVDVRFTRKAAVTVGQPRRQRRANRRSRASHSEGRQEFAKLRDIAFATRKKTSQVRFRTSEGSAESFCGTGR
jgi:hypothetical protein